MEKQAKTYRIAITGPESTGKSELAKGLAEHFGCSWVPEYSREYLKKIGREYVFDDILAIARGQLMLEEEYYQASAAGYLFCDTELLVCKIWSYERFGKCDPWIQDRLNHHSYDLYLLCNTDIQWEPDPLRENPDDRDRLLEKYKKELDDRSLPYAIINGSGNKRINNAIRIVNSYNF